jgi:ferredoxin
MAKRLVIDVDLCTGCETCVTLCPDIFELDSNDKAFLKNPEACDTCDCENVINACPGEAIRWEA